MTREQLEAVHEALTDLVGAWNDASADEDKGPNNHAITLTLWDDGSGRIGVRKFGNEVEDMHGFDDFDGLVKVLTEGEYVEFDKSPS